MGDTEKRLRYMRVVKIRKMAHYMRNLHHSLSCIVGDCTDPMCAQTKTFIRHIETCPYVLEQGKCDLAGCNTTYVLIEHLRNHKRVASPFLPRCFACNSDSDSASSERDRFSSFSSKESERSSSFDSVNSDEESPTVSPKSSRPSDSSDSNCLLCRIAFASVEEERKILNDINGSEKNKAGGRGGGFAKRRESFGKASTPTSPTAAQLFSHWQQSVKEDCVCSIANLTPFISQAPISPAATSLVSPGSRRDRMDFSGALIDLPLARTPHVQATDVDFEEVKAMFRATVDGPETAARSISTDCVEKLGSFDNSDRPTNRKRCLTWTSGDSEREWCESRKSQRSQAF
eukprot:GSChrysophyteH1.ASY1.ANO1.2680.1 assembled CDS